MALPNKPLSAKQGDNMSPLQLLHRDTEQGDMCSGRCPVCTWWNCPHVSDGPKLLHRRHSRLVDGMMYGGGVLFLYWCPLCGIYYRDQKGMDL